MDRASRRSGLLLLCFVVAAVLGGGKANGEPLNLYDWCAVAPIIVDGEVSFEDGKWVAVRAGRVFRGDVAAGAELYVNLRRANRQRNLNADPKALRVEPGLRYVWLLEEEPSEERKGGPAYRLVRGVRGARELPPEGAARVLEALAEFVAIQDLASDALTWQRFGELLEDRNPVLIETALDAFLRFRRGVPELLPSLSPLLDHPQAEIRAAAARLVAQILEIHGTEGLPDEDSLRAAVFASARRDPAPEVRVAAVQAADRFDGRPAVALLEEVAAEDPEQEVRYAAERLLYERRFRPVPPAARD